MSANSTIEWTDHTFNPWEGCQKVGPGCDHCYAEARNARFGGGQAVNWGQGAPRRRTSVGNWKLPKKWNAAPFYECTCCGWRGDDSDPEFKAPSKGCIHDLVPARARVFCASLADVFDNAVEREWRGDLAVLILDTPKLDWLLLTKRIGNAVAMLGEMFPDGVPPNVWLGATICNQEEADRDIRKLVDTPATKRFLSIEPMLGLLDIMKWLEPFTCADCSYHGSDNDSGPDGCEKCGESDAFDDGEVCKSCGADDQAAKRSCPRCGSHRSYELDMGFFWSSEQRLIDWVIVGGESGPGARPMHPDWACSLRDQCATAGVPFLFKQWGEWFPISQQAEEFTHRLYRSNRKARLHEDQCALDDCYGRTCLVEQAVIHEDGSVHAPLAPMAFLQGTGAMLTFKAGKKAAGRLLDGREWNEVPQ